MAIHHYKLSIDQAESIVQGLDTGVLLTANILDMNNVVANDPAVDLESTLGAVKAKATAITADFYIVSLVTDRNNTMQELNVAAINQAISTQYNLSNLIFRYVAL